MKLNVTTIDTHIYKAIHITAFLFFIIQPSLCSSESESVFKLGERYFNDSLYNLAFEQYQKYLSLKRNYDKDPTAYFKSAICQHKMNNYREAVERIEEYIQLFPSESNIKNAMFEAGTIRKKLRDYAEASDWFFSIWSRFGGRNRSQHALFEAAFCAEKDQNFDRAIEFYQLYVDRFPQTENSKQAVFSLVNLYVDRQEFIKAKEVLNATEKRWKKNNELSIRILYYKALIAMNMQQIDLAEKYFQSMGEMDTFKFPEKEQAYKKYIEVLTILKQFRLAHDQFETLSKILAHQSSEALFEFYKLWAENSLRARLYKEAILLYTKIINLYHDSINIYQVQYNLAECYVGIDDFPKAIEILKKIELTDSTTTYSVRALLKSGEIYYNKGLYSSAVVVYRRYLQLPKQENKDQILYKIGKIYQENFNQYDSALREYETLITLYPLSAYYNLSVFSIAQCQEQLKEFKNAVRNYEYLCESGKETAITNEAKKRALYLRNYHLKNNEAAIIELTELIRKQPSSIPNYTRLLKTALIHKKHMKNYKEALDIFQEIEKLQDLPDSLYMKTKLSIANLYYTLYEKATFENDSTMASHSKNMAISYYSKLITTYRKSLYSDEATYKKLILTFPDISEYESFVNKYSSSRYIVDVLLKIGKYYEAHSTAINNKFREKAIEAYQQILTRYPLHKSASIAAIGLVRNYLHLNKLDLTEELIAQYSKQYPNTFVDDEVYYIKGILFIKMSKYEKAIDVFNQILYRYPFSVYAEKARFELALVLQKLDRTFEALNNYRRYIQDYPNGHHKTSINYGIAKCFVQLEKHNEAIKIFNKLLDSALTDELVGDIHFELGNIAKNENNIYEALNHYKTALAVTSFSNKNEIRLLMGDIYFEKKLYVDAETYYAQVLSKMNTEVDSVRIMTKLISSLIMSGKTKKAQKAIITFNVTYGKTYRDNYAEIIYYEGTYLLIKKKYDKAISKYKYILNNYTESDRVDDAEYQIALIFYYQNNMEEALALFQKFSIKYPDSEFVPLTYFKIAMIFHGQNDFVRSAENFTKVINAENVDVKTRFKAVNNAAVALQKISSWNEAAQMYKIILSEFSEQVHLSSYHLKAGFCFLQASNTLEAFKQFEKAIVNPKKEEEPEILYWMATCYSKLGEYSKAITEFLKVPFFYSGFGKWGITAEFEAARLYERQGEYHKAAMLYRKVVRSDGEQGRFGKKALAMIQRLNTLAGDDK